MTSGSRQRSWHRKAVVKMDKSKITSAQSHYQAHRKLAKLSCKHKSANNATAQIRIIWLVNLGVFMWCFSLYVSGMLTELDAVLGPLSLTSSMTSMVRYTRQGVDWLRLDSRTGN